MKVQYLSLKNFRNVEETVFKPDPGLNVLVGLNGQGKTSIIEAISLLATLRSFRDSKIFNLIWSNMKLISSIFLSTFSILSSEKD